MKKTEVAVFLGIIFASASVSTKAWAIWPPQQKGRQDNGGWAGGTVPSPEWRSARSGARPAPEPEPVPVPQPTSPLPAREPAPQPVPEPAMRPAPHSGTDPLSRELTFNVYCRFDIPFDAAERRIEGVRRCYAGARFEKIVSVDGAEFADDSTYPRNPAFEVECDGARVYTAAARRFTDRDGTRIQAQGGAYPALLLPEGTLASGRRKVSATLELRDFALEGSCLVYTGDR